MNLSKRFLDVLRELIGLVGEDNIQEIEIERRFWGGGKVRIVKATAAPPPAVSVPVSPAPHPEPQQKEPVPADETDGLHQVLSPMVGMFYRASSPDAPPFVEEGDVVSTGQTLCIIEAMKIMNEIESDVKGRVVRTLVENGKPVEYNTPLFLLEPL